MFQASDLRYFQKGSQVSILELKQDVLPKKGRKTSMFPSFQMEADDDFFEGSISTFSRFNCQLCFFVF